jgi:hypothetical protein
MFLKCDPYRVWCSIFYSKLVNCILLRSLFVFVKGRGTCGSGEKNVKIWIDFRKSPRFSLTSPLSQEREKSSRPVFTMCGEPWFHISKISPSQYIWYIVESRVKRYNPNPKISFCNQITIIHTMLKFVNYCVVQLFVIYFACSHCNSRYTIYYCWWICYVTCYPKHWQKTLQKKEVGMSAIL